MIGADIWKRFRETGATFLSPKEPSARLFDGEKRSRVLAGIFNTSHDLTAIAPVPAQSGRQSVDSCRESHWTPAGLGVLFSKDGLSKTDRSVLRLALPRGVPAVAAS